MHGHQALEGFEEQVLVAHDQVTAFNQAQAQVACEISVFEIGFVVGPGGEQCQMGVCACRAHGLEAVHERAVSAGQALHTHGLKSIGELAGNSQAVFQQVAQTRWRLAALADHPPVAVRAARQVEGRNVQMGAAHRLDAMHGPQVTRVSLYQCGWQKAFFQQLLWAVHIGHHFFQQTHPLHDAGLNFLPALRFNQQREQIERPGALGATFIGIDVVSNTVVPDLALQCGGALIQLLGTLLSNIFEELSPSPRQMVVISY